MESRDWSSDVCSSDPPTRGRSASSREHRPAARASGPSTTTTGRQTPSTTGTESSWPRGSARTRDRGEEEAGGRPRRTRHLLAGRGAAEPSRSRWVHRLGARSHGSRRLRRLAARDSLSFERAMLSRDDERRIASFEPRSSVALLPVASSRGTAARAGRGSSGPSRSSAHGADCLREPAAPSLRASPGARRASELAALGAANAGVR